MSCEQPTYTQENELERIRNDLELFFEELEQGELRKNWSKETFMDTEASIGKTESTFYIIDLNDPDARETAFDVKLAYKTKPFSVSLARHHSGEVLSTYTHNTVKELITDTKRVISSFKSDVNSTRSVLISYEGLTLDDRWYYQSNHRLDK
jgi:hypothetical protein